MTRTTVADILACCAVAALTALVLVPALARSHRTPAEAKCQSNMRRWAEAVALYTDDNNGRYPTNRTKLSQFTVRVLLSDPTVTDPVTGQPIRFQYGISWVEALYSYIQESAARTGQDWKSFRRCPNASSATYPTYGTGSANACMTYVFNYNLLEYNREMVRDPRKTMVMREFDRLLNSELRPSILSPDSTVLPSTPFLTTFDQFATRTNANLHGNGSYIVLADGHVGYFTTDYFPITKTTSKVNCWDDATQQWWNWAPGSGKPAYLIKAIAITP